MIWLIKSLFCKHEKQFVRNIYGDEIIFGTPDFHRSLWRCKKCGKAIYEQQLNSEQEPERSDANTINQGTEPR